MLNIYTSYVCYRCRREFVLLSQDTEQMKGYLVCPYCSSKHIKREKISDNLKECMQERSYVRVKGAIRQNRSYT